MLSFLCTNPEVLRTNYSEMSPHEPLNTHFAAFVTKCVKTDDGSRKKILFWK